MSKWFGPNNDEFACPCCGLNRIDPLVVALCDDVRDELGIPLIITSGTRCPTHNAAVGGAPRSAHLPGPDAKSHAADIRCNNDILRAKIHAAFAARGIARFEVSNKHIHVDNAWYLPGPILAAVTFAGAAKET